MSTAASTTRTDGGTAALEVDDIKLSFGRVIPYQDVTFTVGQGELFAVIGPNGAGKTSLFNTLSRVYEPDSGGVRFYGEDLLKRRPKDLAGLGIGRTFQNLGLYADLSVLENVLVGRHHLMKSGPISGGLWIGPARKEEREHRAAVTEAMEFVGIAKLAERKVGSLSYGLKKRVEFARALAMEPRLLLLDEPVAGMGSEERVEMTDLVRRIHRERGLTILLVEHDMGMVMSVAQRVLVLDFGRPISLGTPAQVTSDERVIKAYLGEESEGEAA